MQLVELALTADEAILLLRQVIRNRVYLILL